QHPTVQGGGCLGRLAAVLQVLGDHRGGERDQPGPQQQVQIQQQQRPVHLDDLGEDPMVVEPDDPDGQEADQVGDIAGPLGPQGVRERLALAELWGADVDDQQGDGDGEPAVAEGLQPRGGHDPNRPGRARHRPTPSPWVAGPCVTSACRTGCVRAGPRTWRTISASSSAPRPYRAIPAATSLPGNRAPWVRPAGRERWGCWTSRLGLLASTGSHASTSKPGGRSST